MLTLDLTGQVAVVTGGSGELGRVICRTLAECGADIGFTFFSGAERAEKLTDELTALGRRAMAACVDVSDEASVNAFRDEVETDLGTASIVVTNAVVQIHPWKPVLEQALADYQSQFDSCVMHNVLMARAFLPGMIAAKNGGRIIGINTECSMQNFANYSAYSAGKRGMDGIFRVLAREVGEHQITVNQVAPGWMISDKYRTEHGVDPQPNYEKSVPLKRRGTDQDIANMVAFLASDLANFVTGQFISVSGGNVMPTI